MTMHFALFLSVLAIAVIVALPTALAVTFPFESTETILELLELHFKSLLVAVVGLIVATRLNVFFTLSDNVVLLSDIPETFITGIGIGIVVGLGVSLGVGASVGSGV